MSFDGQLACLGQQFAESIDRQLPRQPGVAGRISGPDTEIGVAALVAGPGAEHGAQRQPAGRTGRQRCRVGVLVLPNGFRPGSRVWWDRDPGAARELQGAQEIAGKLGLSLDIQNASSSSEIERSRIS